MKNWVGYFEKTIERKQHPLLEIARGIIKINDQIRSMIQILDNNKEVESTKNETLTATDLGCGTGGDTLYLLLEGYAVTAVDSEPQALGIVQKRASEKGLPSPTLVISPMESISLKNQQDLITSNLALPFVAPTNMHKAWSAIVQGLKFDGVFSGQFFGPHHQWRDDETMTFHDVGELKNLFRGLFKILYFNEEQAPVNTAFQGEQYWHQYDIVAVRKPASPEILLSYYGLTHSENKVTHAQQSEEGLDKHPSNKLTVL